ncbi:hypothetical protein NSK_002082 [Nannochloropsis salina CCMP1776]|uniref:Uncharacterized protein n=1 Tax=Nannochloropsis salina CCMP1776 TaxID=1027361 RepID=A0A4D9DAE5_9STRA|nr:hypothetical protein NSK_002082 [Nannochloropsis salina CCMP1776]|eukprot:TFJ86425.1 hypothetical protein NSK_002082 [Nannochloropsis salina CCMP1776]
MAEAFLRAALERGREDAREGGREGLQQRHPVPRLQPGEVVMLLNALASLGYRPARPELILFARVLSRTSPSPPPSPPPSTFLASFSSHELTTLARAWMMLGGEGEREGGIGEGLVEEVLKVVVTEAGGRSGGVRRGGRRPLWVHTLGRAGVAPPEAFMLRAVGRVQASLGGGGRGRGTGERAEGSAGER